MLRSAVLSFLRLGSLLSFGALGACSYTEHQSAYGNGESSQLVFSSAATAPTTPVAVGYALKVTVERNGAGDVHCTGLGVHDYSIANSAGAVQTQGGSINTEHCDSLPSDVVTFVSASCADDTCVATTVATDPRLVTLTVTGAHAGTTHLHVVLKSNDDGKTYEDSIALRFEAPARIRLAADPREIDAMKGPVLPGVAFTKPRASVIDAQGEELEIGDALTPTPEGSAFVDTLHYPPFEAQAPGHTVLRWSYPGVADRTIDLEVVDPSEARALFVYAPLEAPPAGTAAPAVDTDPGDAPPAAEPTSGRITSIDLVEYDFHTYPLRVRLADGRFALCNIAEPAVAPAALGSSLSGLALSAFDFEAKAAGGGTITLRAAPGATMTLPVKVTARPPR